MDDGYGNTVVTVGLKNDVEEYIKSMEDRHDRVLREFETVIDEVRILRNHLGRIERDIDQKIEVFQDEMCNWKRCLITKAIKEAQYDLSKIFRDRFDDKIKQMEIDYRNALDSKIEHCCGDIRRKYDRLIKSDSKRADNAMIRLKARIEKHIEEIEQAQKT